MKYSNYRQYVVSLAMLILVSSVMVGEKSQVLSQERPELLLQVVWSPDEQLLAAFSSNGSEDRIIVYDNTMSVLTEITYPDSAQVIRDMSWAPDSQRLAVIVTGAITGFPLIEVWDVRTGTVLTSYQDQDSGAGLSGLAWRPNSEQILYTDGPTDKLLDDTTGTIVRVFDHPERIQNTRVTWSQNGIYFAAPTSFGVQVWNGETGEWLGLFLNDDIPTSAIWLDSEEHLLVAEQDEIIVWDILSRQIIQRFVLPEEIRAIGSPDANSTYVVALGLTNTSPIEARAIIWDANTSEVIEIFPTYRSGAEISINSQNEIAAGGPEAIPIVFSPTQTQSASIRGLIWQDLNADGLQPGEENNGIAGVTVNLYDAADTQVATTTTASDGTYTFEVEPDTPYTIEVIPPEGFNFTLPDVGDDDTLDSDIDPATGRTPPITVTVGQSDDTWDAGVVFYNLDEEEDFGER